MVTDKTTWVVPASGTTYRRPAEVVTGPLPGRISKSPETTIVRGLDFAACGLAPGEVLRRGNDLPGNAVVITPSGHPDDLTAPGGLMWAYTSHPDPVTVGDRVFQGDNFDADDPASYTSVGFRLAGGRLNVTYEVRVRVLTSRGQVIEKLFWS